jgi:hypothetical protein
LQYSDFADPGDRHYPELLNHVTNTVIAGFTGQYLTRLLSPLVLSDYLLFYYGFLTGCIRECETLFAVYYNLPQLTVNLMIFYNILPQAKFKIY